MKWARYRIRTKPEAEDLIISEVTALGLAGAQIEDNVPLTAAEKEQIYTYDADDPVDDGIAYVSFYAALDDEGFVLLPENDTEKRMPAEKLRAQIADALIVMRTRTDIGDGILDVSVMDDSEWKDKWKQFFHRFYIDDILVTPSWETGEAPFPDEAEAPDGTAPHTLTAYPRPAYTLRIDPGTAFGTGAHETTQLAIRLLRKYMPQGARVLDVGTGSGILGILALFFGAAKVVGVDVDAFTEDAVRQNLISNRTESARFTLEIGNLLEDEAFRRRVRALSGGDDTQPQGYEIVVANILPVVLEPLTPLVPEMMTTDGVYITSGILCEKEGGMRSVLEKAGFTVVEVMRQGEWCAMAAKRMIVV